MSERITDQAWRQIVNVSPARGTRGLVFRMHRSTYWDLCAFRAVKAMHTLYSVAIIIDNHVPVGMIRLEER